jgi:hypothetical protein
MKASLGVPAAGLFEEKTPLTKSLSEWIKVETGIFLHDTDADFDSAKPEP